MAKNYLENLLGENERVVLETHQHWFVLFNKIFLEIILVAIIVAAVIVGQMFSPLAVYGLILVLVPLVGLVRDVMVWQNNAYIVTNRRVIQISGVFSKEVVDSSLENRTHGFVIFNISTGVNAFIRSFLVNYFSFGKTPETSPSFYRR